MSKIADFIARKARRVFPDSAYLEQHTGPRTWDKAGVEPEELIAAYDDLLVKHGAREDFALPHLPMSDWRSPYARWVMGRSLKSYDKWRNARVISQMRLGESGALAKLMEVYDRLLDQYGPDPDYRLPSPRADIRVHGGSLSRHDIPARMAMDGIGSTLQDYALYRMEQAAQKNGLWVKSRGRYQFGDKWTRRSADAETGRHKIEITDSKPADDLFDTAAARRLLQAEYAEHQSKKREAETSPALR